MILSKSEKSRINHMKSRSNRKLFYLAAGILFLIACEHEPQDFMPDDNNGNEPGTCDTINVSYKGSVYPIFENHCLSCHSGPNPDYGIDLTNYSDVAAIAQNGTLLGALKRLEGYYPMPKDQQPLDVCEIRTIEIWINDTTFEEIECDTSNLTFPGTVQPILQAKCFECHSGQNPEAGIDLSDYSQVATLAQNGALLGVIKHEPGYVPMPQNGSKLDSCSIAQIEKWVNDTSFNNPPGGDPCHPDTIYFEKDLLPVLQSSCALANCHDDITQEDGVQLTDYASVMATADVDPFDPEGSDLYEVLIETDPDKRMPPPPNNPLTQEQINMVYKWIAQGAQDLHCDEDCDTVNVTFGGTVWPMVQNSCFGCHSGGNPSGGIPLENHADLVAVAETGQLMGALNWEAGYANMPRNGNQWSVCDRRAVEIWIEEGMPNN